MEFLAAIGFAMLLEFVLNYAPPKIHPDKFRKVALIISLVLLLLSLSDLRFRVDSLNPEEFPGNYMGGVLNYIGNDNGTGWRYYQWGGLGGITQGSRVAFTPALTKKPALDGWYRQGDPAIPGIAISTTPFSTTSILPERPSGLFREVHPPRLQL